MRSITLAIHKYGWSGFDSFVLEVCETQEALDAAEQYWIMHYNSMTPGGYNLKEGGNGGRMSEEAKRKISEAQTGKKMTEERAARMRGRKHPPRTEETKAKLSAVGKLRVHSEETRQKMSESQSSRVRKPCSEETKRKIAEALKGRNQGVPLSVEHRQKISASRRGQQLGTVQNENQAPLHSE
jgi:group I intron endonuclease